MSLLIQPCLLNSLSDKGAVHDQNISKKKKNISIDSIDSPKTPFIFKDMKLSPINKIPCMFKINLKSNTNLKLFTVVQLFNRCSWVFFYILKLARFFSFSQTWNFHQVIVIKTKILLVPLHIQNLFENEIQAWRNFPFVSSY